MAKYINDLISSQEWVVFGRGPRQLVDDETKIILDLMKQRNVKYNYINVLDDVNLKTDFESQTNQSVPAVFHNGNIVLHSEI